VYGFTEQQTDNSLTQMIDNQEISFDSETQQIMPHFLSRKVSIAQAALFFPDGDHYSELAGHINENRLCGNKDVSTVRPDNALAVAHDSGYIYQSGRGLYRHICFLSISDETVKDILIQVIQRLENSAQNGVDSLNLKVDIHAKLNMRCEYYQVRYIVKEYGHMQGIFFKGKSHADTVSLQSNFNLQTQEHSILEAFTSDPSARTPEDIQRMIRSGSLNHAHLYINSLVQQGNLVRVAYNLYDIPQTTFKDAPIEAILTRTKNVLEQAKRPVDSEYLASDCNSYLHLDYTKQWYLSCLKYHEQQFPIYCYHSLISLQPLNGLTITEIINKYISETICNDELYRLLSKKVLANKNRIINAISTIKAPRSM
jgi:hypothetical protein